MDHVRYVSRVVYSTPCCVQLRGPPLATATQMSRHPAPGPNGLDSGLVLRCRPKLSPILKAQTKHAGLLQGRMFECLNRSSVRCH